VNKDSISMYFSVKQNKPVSLRLCVIPVVRQGGSECYVKYCHVSRGSTLDLGKGGTDVLQMYVVLEHNPDCNTRMTDVSQCNTLLSTAGRFSPCVEFHQSHHISPYNISPLFLRELRGNAHSLVKY